MYCIYSSMAVPITARSPLPSPWLSGTIMGKITVAHGDLFFNAHTHSEN
jgi:hypothetical protein